MVAVTDNPFGLPPEEAIQWFREKGYALTFDWQEMYGEQHARAFTVAKATQLNVLADIRAAVDEAIKNGTTRQQFTKNLRPLLQQAGWWGEKEVKDPKTGETKLVQLGSARRLRTIYETNLRQAHAAARWERIERTAQQRPYLRYVCVSDGRERPEHRRWHNTILPWDHPWWKTHSPPNGWGCRCKIMQLSERDLERYGLKVSDRAPVVKMVEFKNTHTGKTIKVPKGIDPSFDYNPGLATRGFTPHDNAPVLTPVRNFADYGRPAAKAIPRDAVQSTELWPPARSAKDQAAQRDRWSVLFGKEEAAIKDPSGDSVMFTQRYLDHLMNDDKGAARSSFVPLAKSVVENPFEVWMVPMRLRDGTVVMRKRYIGLADDADKGGFLLVVDRGDDGYAAWTSYPRANLDSKREGYLLYAAPQTAA